MIFMKSSKHGDTSAINVNVILFTSLDILGFSVMFFFFKMADIQYQQPHFMTLASLQRLSTALNILEKYGCNLTNPNRPKYWRTVKHNNPVFRATVDAIQGGRAVLCLYGYSNQQPDGLSFPDDVTDPDVGRVAAVTLEVMSLRMELEMLIKETHPHPEFYERILATLRHKDVGLNTDAVVYYSSAISCNSDGQSKSLAFPLHHHSTRGSSHSHSLSSNHQGLRSIQVFSTSSNKHPDMFRAGLRSHISSFK
uniref:uncharacterized protein LOC122787039 isoform X2 n=1 Tax=Solea senegalensis TaxID=28829 RepID=UPI001CD8E1B0|nr:uncharacterized protein LOC122787039 isoform X2 [Solea senegalensis]